jgi:hypothetical protein
MDTQAKPTIFGRIGRFFRGLLKKDPREDPTRGWPVFPPKTPWGPPGVQQALPPQPPPPPDEEGPN